MPNASLSSKTNPCLLCIGPSLGLRLAELEICIFFILSIEMLSEIQLMELNDT